MIRVRLEDQTAIVLYDFIRAHDYYREILIRGEVPQTILAFPFHEAALLHIWAFHYEHPVRVTHEFLVFLRRITILEFQEVLLLLFSVRQLLHEQV